MSSTGLERHRGAQGRNHGSKVEGDQGLGPNTRLAHGQRPGWMLGARGGRPHTVRVRGITPEDFFENSDAKSCILVTTMLISGLRTTRISKQTILRPKSWGTNILLVPQPKS